VPWRLEDGNFIWDTFVENRRVTKMLSLTNVVKKIVLDWKVFIALAFQLVRIRKPGQSPFRLSPNSQLCPVSATILAPCNICLFLFLWIHNLFRFYLDRRQNPKPVGLYVSETSNFFTLPFSHRKLLGLEIAMRFPFTSTYSAWIGILIFISPLLNLVATAF
jgi:hypothetical protein